MKISNYFLSGEIHTGSDLVPWLLEESGIGGTQAAASIVIHINSPGGDFLAATQIINMIRSSPIPVTTLLNGAAESAALLILMAGHRRGALKNSTGMAHHISTSLEGGYHQIKATLKQLKLLHDNMYNLWREFSLMETSLIHELVMGKTDLYMDTNDMLRFGIIDEILEPGKEVGAFIRG